MTGVKKLMDQKCPSESIPFFVDTSERLYTQLWEQILGSTTSGKWEEEKLGTDSGTAVVADLTTASSLASGSMDYRRHITSHTGAGCIPTDIEERRS